jgi:hypothetical protein
VGLKGIAAIRAVLNWAPVQAHATSHRVTAYYVTKSPSSAAFLSEWDQWREAGVSACWLVSDDFLSCIGDVHRVLFVTFCCTLLNAID